MQLSEHFHLSEFTKSATASRRGIPNEPRPWEVENLKRLCNEILEPVRAHFGKPVIIRSGYRSPRLNVAVGGSRTSDHCHGNAADFEIIGVSNFEVAKWIEQKLNYHQLILEFYTPGKPNSGWIHVGYRGRPFKNQELTATRVRGRTRYLSGLRR
jgi:zinc D-Ala-D-Ala carboxypeptidase